MFALLILKFIFLAFIGVSWTQSTTESPQQCGGYIFTSEMLVELCGPLFTLFNISREIVPKDLPDVGNGFSIRGFGGLSDQWSKIKYMNALGFLERIDYWTDIYNDSCLTAPGVVHYSQYEIN